MSLCTYTHSLVGSFSRLHAYTQNLYLIMHGTRFQGLRSNFEIGGGGGGGVGGRHR